MPNKKGTIENDQSLLIQRLLQLHELSLQMSDQLNLCDESLTRMEETISRMETRSNEIDAELGHLRSYINSVKELSDHAKIKSEE